ncbi:MAG: DEAD/DEAH box helicase family protein [Atopobiaceae bacterium]|nr:DEAD/DEAH box helicase family protein [Atopobiaceae bacterium]
MEFLSNEGVNALGDKLRSSLSSGDRLSIISSYFTVFAFGELKDELLQVDELRFLFDEPTFVEQMAELKEPKEFMLSKRGRERGIGGTGLELTLRNNLNQRALAHECAEWVRAKASFRSARSRGMVQSGSVYHLSHADGSADGFQGFNLPFTLEGLGYERKAGVVGGYGSYSGASEAAGLKAMFDGVWDNPSMVADVTERVAEQIGTLYRENAPEFVYFLTLYHVFRDFMADMEESDPIKPGLSFTDSIVWNKLYDFQRDAVVGAIRKLEKYKGCIIADSVGLGKTFEALAVIKYYQERNDRVLVLCPKRLRENWTLYTGNDERNPLVDDRLNFDVLNHTDLSRYTGFSGDINLETLRWGNYDLIVIDESHNFRNKPTDRTQHSRYDRLMEDIIRAGVRTKVLMLSATPVNNKLLDLRNQIEIITEGDDAYLAETDGIGSVTAVCRLAQQRFGEWSELPDELRTTERFVASVNADYFKLLDILTIARSRKHIAKYYRDETATFPTRLKPISLHPRFDTQDELPSIADMNDLIASLSFAQYQLLSYVMPGKQKKYADRYADTWGNDFESQVNRTHAVANLMRVNLLKRMESSINSFRITLERVLGGTRSLLDQLDNLSMNATYEADELAEGFDDDDDAEEFEAGGKVRVDLRDVDALRLGQDLDFDIQMLRALLAYADAVTPERDAKLVKLRDFIAEKVRNPYNPGNRKVLVFSAFADTTAYLFEQLAPWLKRELGIECAEVAGSSNRTYSMKLPRTTFENILARFSPVSKELPESQRALGEIDVVFATDCISEGQNLQDCDCLVNYDIHWNPVRIIQRFGRIDRLGSKNSQIQLVNFWPDIALDEYIQLEGRVKGRMALLDASATGEENVLEAKGNGEMNDLKYRRQQLQQLKSEVLDLEDISGGISITDFAFDDFRVELQRYAKEHPGALENSPAGLHAVAPIPDELRGDVKPGVVFCLKQNDEGNDPRDTNPVFPYYVVYVSADGEVMTKHTQPKPALDIMRAVCSGHPEPIAELCREFNRETRDRTRMDAYTDLLDDVVAAITGTQQDKGIESLFSLGEVGSGTVMGFNDYSLVCFAVLR